jgi:ubiquinone/menaquinone biosynthesis C-methylase UbiE
MNIEHFDRQARTWDDDPAKRDRALAVAAAIRDKLPPMRRLRALEYGCGTGLLSFALQADLAHITAADSSPGMLAVLRDKIAATGAANIAPLQLDLSVDPPPAEKYGLIATMMTFHHVPDIDKLLRDLYAMLERSGYLCVADLDTEDGSFHGPDFDGHKGFDRDELSLKAMNAGFRKVEMSTVFRITKGDAAGQKEFPVFLMIAKK